ncbi:MAG TPA: type II toxin-antitoxin system PrlF family antitoxin [Terracidiphilus sp.]|nr:type II toxin-antitoxin system PrlF family antitoxin [Terracidiphilus sp.]
MPALKKKKPATHSHSSTAEYRGTQTRTGNSLGFRFEGALFKSHPEFNGPVKAQVIAPGRMLVVAENARRQNQDPAMAAFLAFLAQDVSRNPQDLRALDADQMARIGKLTKSVNVDPQEDLGDTALL